MNMPQNLTAAGTERARIAHKADLSEGPKSAVYKTQYHLVLQIYFIDVDISPL